ncbi:MAG: transcriptional regulator [Actinobacteria bacterium]|nr:MAG: transcriptional regulator [Actinomycetota bacterium]
MVLETRDAERVAEIMAGLATAARVMILSRLMDSPATVTELIDSLNMSQTSVSNHLRVLRHLDMVTGERQGRNVVYRLHDDHVRSMVEQILKHTRHV